MEFPPDTVQSEESIGIAACSASMGSSFVPALAMRRGSRVLFSALVLFSSVECCTAAKTKSVLVDEYSMQLTVRALLGEEMRTQDKKLADMEKQIEKQ
ncbi:MAG: hypothetical protein VYA21_01750, partial [Verrucomicrobiota bacterium]|nr:hypothetical protein [Verrucomicrobiota bacterium]